jgi:hypothetical protein
LVVFATSEKHDMLGAVVRELEKEAAMEDAREAEKHAREADENAAARKVKIFSLQHLKADEAAQAVAAIVTGPTVAVDRRTNSIIASGLNGELDVLEALLQRLDQPPPSAPPAKSYEVELFALMERPADGPTFKTEAALEDRGKLKPDASLEKTVEELKRQGFGQVWQASRANVLVRLGGTFKAENAGLLVHSNVSGVLSEAAGGLLQLKITVQQERREAVEPKYAAPPRPVSAQLSTEITANLNHDIVLGTVGVNVYGLQIRRVAYVIRVTEATPSQESEKPME